MMKCHTNECATPAAFRVYWPGQETVMCDECCARAIRIATHMGFVLSTVPLVEWITPVTDPDAQP